MISSRLVDALRRREWSGFAVELALLISGVLIALQVDNWNDQRLGEAARAEIDRLLGGADAQGAPLPGG